MGNAGSGARTGKSGDTAPPSPTHRDDRAFDFDKKSPLYLKDAHESHDEDGPLYAEIPKSGKENFENHKRPRAATVSEGPKSSESHEGKMLPTVFKWDGGGKQVYICGTFSEWKTVPMVKSHGDFVTIIDLPEGEHEYKFCVDGEMKCDPSLSVKDTGKGDRANVITVKDTDFEVFQALNMDNGSAPRQMQTVYGQEVPPNKPWEKTTGPPILPPHLLQVILNKDTPLSCEPTLLPEPNHVMLNHLYALSIKDGVMVLSATHRYRKKCVTTLLYKPI